MSDCSTGSKCFIKQDMLSRFKLLEVIAASDLSFGAIKYTFFASDRYNRFDQTIAIGRL